MCTLKIRRPLVFPCAPDPHWARNLFRLEFSSNSLQIHFKFTWNMLANSLVFSSFFYKFVSICFKKPVALFNLLQIRFKSEKITLKWSEICRWLLNGIKHMCSFVGLNNCFLKVLPTSKFWGRNFHFFLATSAWNEKNPYILGKWPGKVFDKACYL